MIFLNIVLSLYFLQLSLAELNCTSGETYVRLVMKCENWCYEQKVNIASGNASVYEGPIYVNYATSDTEACITTSASNQYILKLSDTSGDGWTSGSYLTIYGKYGNVFFYNYMISRTSEDIPLSLYYPIERYQVWKMSDQYSADWMKNSFEDSGWNDETMGSVSGVYSGTQYFRKAFTGISGMAAYEVRMNYCFGVIAYVNGVEVFRDNMPEGSVTQSTAATSQYNDVAMRGFIRPGSEITDSGIFAAELHFTSEGSQSSVDFDALLAAVSSAITDENCFIYPYTTTLTASSTAYQLSNIFDMDRGTYASLSSFEGKSINYAMDLSVIPFINGFRYYISYYYSNIMSATVYGIDDNEGEHYLMEIKGSSVSQTYQLFFSYWLGGIYKNYRIDINSISDSYLEINELMPMVCSPLSFPTTIEFEQSSYEVLANLEDVSITPKLIGVNNCTITPQLPSGLTFNSDTCSVTGSAIAASPQTTYTVTSQALSLSGTFSLTIIGCSGTVVSILRTYQSSASYESFSVMDPDTMEVLYSVAAGSGQPSHQDVSTNLCVTIPRVRVDVSCTTSSWYSDSFLYINTMLGSEESETLLRARYDNNLGLDQSYYVEVNYPIHPVENWYYKMGDVPSNWYSSDTSGWEQSRKGEFPDSTNRVQLYKKTFSITSLENIAGFTLSVRYRYGISVYLNNVEIFKNGITEVSTSAVISNIYPSLLFHTMSFPAKTMAIDSEPAVYYLQSGSNTISIALISNGDTTVDSTFDAVLGLMGNNEYSRVFDYTTSTSGSLFTTGDPFAHCYYNSIYGYFCNTNSFTISFNNDRREWISSVLIQSSYTEAIEYVRQFKVYGKNQADSDWILLGDFTNLGWSLIGQTKKIWLKNNKSYNQYKFENFGSGISDCDWRVNRIDMYSDSMNVDVSDLSYPTVPAIVNIEMAEVYPTNEYYRDYSVSPALPDGLNICSGTGVIYGTPTSLTDPRDYVVTATKVTTGTNVTATINFGVTPCTGGKAFMTSKIRIDSYSSECSYKLYQGRGNGGQLLAEISEAPTSNTLLYLDRCLDDGLYTFYGIDSWGDGWAVPGGYMLTVDVGATIYESKQIPGGTKPVEVGTTFSSYLPFQKDYSEWKVLKTALSDNSWTSIGFDDSGWTTSTSANIGPSTSTTTYIRKTFNIPNLNDYQVLNVRILYAGGVVAYFNGIKVARFNLASTYDSATPALSIHDANLFSGFHVILGMNGAVAGDNVMAFEIHNPPNVASTNVVFDATGIFGVEECSMVLDTYTDFDGSEPSSQGITLADFFDYDLLTYGFFPSSEESQILYNVENLEGTTFNSYGIMSWSSVSGLGFSLMGNSGETENEEYINFATEINVSLSDLGTSTFETPINFIPFRHFKWVIESAGSSSIYLSSFLFYYCKADGEICQGIDEFPTVGEGQMSPALCEYGFKGYKYRLCSNGQLGEVNTEKCTYKEPTGLVYGQVTYEFVLGTQVSTGNPSFENIITTFSVSPSLPAGLSIDPTTGVISGIPTEEKVTALFTVIGSNPISAAQVEINISVRKGRCLAEGFFATTNVGETAVHECASEGSYVGTQTRQCILGERDGEWGSTSGMCVSVLTIVILVVVVIIVVAILIVILLRVTRRKKAVGGVRRKKPAAPNKKPQEKGKQVKV